MENISAVNKIVTIVLDTKSAAVQLSVPMKAFAFERSLMQEHFNENYVESDRFPNSTFKGTVTNNSSIRYNTPGTYEATVEGALTIHGVTRPIQAKGTITVDQQALRVTTTFNVLIADYKITVPALVADKISKSVTITLNAKLDPLTR